MIDNRVEGIFPIMVLPFDEGISWGMDIAFSPDGKELLVTQPDNVAVWRLGEQPIKRTIFQIEEGIWRAK